MCVVVVTLDPQQIRGLEERSPNAKQGVISIRSTSPLR